MGSSISSSVSSTKQFVVHGSDLTIRSTFCLLCEETAAALGRLLKDDGRFSVPVVISVKTPPDINPAEAAVKPSIVLMNHGGIHLQVTAQLRNDFRAEDFNRELVRVLLAERILRDKKEINTEGQRAILPEWFLTGALQAMEFRSRTRPSVRFSAVFKSGQVYSIDRILAADPKNLDAFSRGVYEISSCALVLTLLDQPDGSLRVQRFLAALATDARPGRELLQQHFPSLGVSKNSLEKWWTLQMASLATPSAFESMTVAETEDYLDKALTLYYTERVGEEPQELKEGKEGKGIFGWLKRDRKPQKEEEPATPPPVAASAPPPLPAGDLPPLPPGLAAPPSMPAVPSDASLPPLPLPLREGATPLAPPQSAAAPMPLDAPPPAPAPTPASDTPPPAPAPAPDMPKPGSIPAEPESGSPPAAAPAKQEPGKPAPAPETPAKTGTDSKSKPKPEPSPAPAPAPAPTAKPATAAKPKEAPKPDTAAPAKKPAPKKKAEEEKKADEGEEQKPEKRSFLRKLFGGGKSVTYSVLFIAVAIAESAPPLAPAQEPPAKPDKEAKPAPKKEEAPPALPRRTRRISSKPGDLPEATSAPAPAAPKPQPKPEPETKPQPKPEPKPEPKPATQKAEDKPSADEDAPKKPGRFNPLGWFKRGDAKKEEADTPPAEKPSRPSRPQRKKAAPEPDKDEEPEVAKPEPTTPPPSVPAIKPAPRKPGMIALEDYQRIWKRPDRTEILQRNLTMLNALLQRAHPLYRPLVEEYISITQQLLKGSDKGIAARFESLRQRRMQIQGLAKTVESHLDWYEASETQSYSHLFDDYLKLRDRLDRERTPRGDAVSQYLDSVEKEYE